MKYSDLSIQTHREAPNNARTQGFAFLVRAGYLTRENQPTILGEKALKHLEELSLDLGNSFFPKLGIPTLETEEEVYYPIEIGPLNIINCPACGYTARSELARFAKDAPLPEEALPTERIATPDCNTIEELANFLGVPKEKTAKALLYSRLSDDKLVFAVVRGDMQLSEDKLKAHIGDVKPALFDEIELAGAVAGYASPIGLKDVLIIVDDLIPNSPNLVAGANEVGYHLKNVNYGRDYNAEIIADLALAEAGQHCVNCKKPLSDFSAERLASKAQHDFHKILLALANSHFDENGLIFHHPAAPFDVYLMNIPGKTMDTRVVSTELYEKLQKSGIRVLLDDRDDRAGVKFNDADLIGSPVRVTVGERGLQNGMLELKPRSTGEKSQVPLENISEEIQNLLERNDL